MKIQYHAGAVRRNEVNVVRAMGLGTKIREYLSRHKLPPEATVRAFEEAYLAMLKTGTNQVTRTFLVGIPAEIEAMKAARKAFFAAQDQRRSLASAAELLKAEDTLAYGLMAQAKSEAKKAQAKKVATPEEKPVLPGAIIMELSEHFLAAEAAEEAAEKTTTEKVA